MKTIIKTNYWKMEELKKAAPACRLLFSMDIDKVEYKTLDGRKREMHDNIKYHADYNAAFISHGFASGPRGKITFRPDHECFKVAAVAAGYLDGVEELRNAAKIISSAASDTEADAAYIYYSSRPEARRKKEMKETMELVTKEADRAACYVKFIAAREGIPLFIEDIAADLEKIGAASLKAGIAPASGKHCEKIGAWFRSVIALCKETILADEAAQADPEKLPETISTDEAAQADPEKLPETIPADEVAQADPEKLPETIPADEVAQAEAEERPETIPADEVAQADPEKPEAHDDGSKAARGPVKPKDFIGQTLTGRGWNIFFDDRNNRTRVIVNDSIRETVAPIIQEAGFFWSVNMGSYNKKLTHKAHRAALALAEKLEAATA